MFLNSKDVIEKGFKHCSKPDTGVLIILDPNQLLQILTLKYGLGIQ